MKVEFDYTRSLGPVLSRFMSALQQRQVLGGVLSDGRVVVPPPEYDPITHAAVADLVPVSEFGLVTSWSWVSEPVAQQPLERPFAFAQVLLDGADAPLLHAVAVDSPADMSTGMRVRIRWADEPGPWLKLRFERVTIGVDLDEPLTRARTAIATASA